MRITKVKRTKEGQIIIAYLQVRANAEPDQFTLKCSQEPQPGFHQAMSALNRHVAEICEMSEQWGKDLETRSVSLSYKNDVMAATITAMKPLRHSNAPLVISTPHKASELIGEGGDESNCLTSDCVAAINAVIREARNYVNGERAQGSLPLDSDPGEGKVAPLPQPDQSHLFPPAAPPAHDDEADE